MIPTCWHSTLGDNLLHLFVESALWSKCGAEYDSARGRNEKCGVAPTTGACEYCESHLTLMELAE